MRRWWLGAAVVVVAVGLAWPAGAVRLKEIATIMGVRPNKLIGYGLVVGLNGTGDKSSTMFTVQALTNMLNRMGIKVPASKVSVKNVAAVMVTAELPPFARPGTKLDVTLSSLGDAQSLAGGTLIMTPLKGPDGKVYAVAQGPVSVGGFKAGGQAATVSKNHPTVGRIPGGAVVERPLPYTFAGHHRLTVNLNTPDFTTANRVARAINRSMPELKARALDPATIEIHIPEGASDPVALMARLENLRVQPDVPAKVVVDERTGTVVIGENVRIRRVAIASGAISISITERPQVSQALPFAPGGQTVTVPRTQVQVGEQTGALKLVGGGVSIGQLVKALNALGATPRDLIVILQAIKAAGALEADLEII